LERIRHLSIKALERMINRYLMLDPYLQQRLQPLIDKQFLLEITNSALSFYVTFKPHRIEINSTSPNEAPDLLIRGSSLALWRLFQSSSDTFSVHLRDVKVVGDLNLAQSIKTFFHSIDIDWEEQLSHLTGDIIAHQLFRGARTFTSWQGEAYNNFMLNLREYLQDEVRYLPLPEEVEAFGNAVDILRDDVERLEARLERLMI
jgi:ubiquinone biosynthesis accessory factor UbiJ